MRDPRLQSVTLTDVEMSPDLKLARIFWTAHLHQQGGSSEEGPKGPDPSEVKAIDKALQGAGRYLKRRIGEDVRGFDDALTAEAGDDDIDNLCAHFIFPYSAVQALAHTVLT